MEYWKSINKKMPVEIHPKTIKFIDTVLIKISKDGINKTLKPKYLKKAYKSIEKEI